MAQTNHIKVFVRVRPPAPGDRCVPFETTRTTVRPDRMEVFEFDRVFGPATTQAEFYAEALAGFAERALAGYNCTFFAYGQTGTGKTHTMQGALGSRAAPVTDGSGVVPRLLAELFGRLRALGGGAAGRVTATCVEVYRGKVYDLLAARGEGRKAAMRALDISSERVDGRMRYRLRGAREVAVGEEDFVDVLREAARRRRTGQTRLNATSSRSHCIIKVRCEVTERDEEGQERVRVGQVQCVDLAGSENVQRAGVGQEGKQEAVEILKSLSALNTVFEALGRESQGQSNVHVPYDRTVLTQLLQEGLGMGSVVAMVATVSTTKAEEQVNPDSYNTLKYAREARAIQIAPARNAQSTRGELLRELLDSKRQLEAENQKMAWENNRQKGRRAQEVREESKRQLEHLREQLEGVRERNEEMERMYGAVKAEQREAEKTLEEAKRYAAGKEREKKRMVEEMEGVQEKVERLVGKAREYERIAEANGQEIERMREVLQRIQEDRHHEMKEESRYKEVVGVGEKVKAELAREKGAGRERVETEGFSVRGIERSIVGRMDEMVGRGDGMMEEAQEAVEKEAEESAERARWMEADEAEVVERVAEGVDAYERGAARAAEELRKEDGLEEGVAAAAQRMHKEQRDAARSREVAAAFGARVADELRAIEEAFGALVEEAQARIERAAAACQAQQATNEAAAREEAARVEEAGEALLERLVLRASATQHGVEEAQRVFHEQHSRCVEQVRAVEQGAAERTRRLEEEGRQRAEALEARMEEVRQEAAQGVRRIVEAIGVAIGEQGIVGTLQQQLVMLEDGYEGRRRRAQRAQAAVEWMRGEIEAKHRRFEEEVVALQRQFELEGRVCDVDESTIAVSGVEAQRVSEAPRFAVRQHAELDTNGNLVG